MYITYDNRQLSDHREGSLMLDAHEDDLAHHIKNQYHVHPPKRFPDQVPKSAYTPNKLVRVSDMQVVSGTKVKEGYCALSYVWEQSGDIDHETERVDRGKHKLIQWNKTTKGSGKKHSGSAKSSYGQKPKNVFFEDIVQKVCKDFNIRYIWYDQMCIEGEGEKILEIKSMHQIYKHAFGTVALVPEFRVDDSKIDRSGGVLTLGDALSTATKSILSKSKWYQRLWTFQEALMSQNIVFVGENIHAWWYKAYAYPDMHFICNTPQQLHVSTILWYTHIRSCSNEYDRIFTLANLFPDMIDTTTIDYHQSFDPLLIQFYGALAKTDLSILCFGQHLEYKLLGSPSSKNNHYEIPIQQYEDVLPSWTGVHGEHLKENLTTAFQHYTIVDTSMQVTCSFITSVDDPAAITSIPFKPLTFDDLPPLQFLNQDMNANSLKLQRLAIKIQIPGSPDHKKSIVTLDLLSTDIFSPKNSKPSSLRDVSQTLQTLSSILLITKDELFWHDDDNDDSSVKFDFNLTEDTDNYSQYVILAGIPFSNNNLRSSYAIPPYKIYPVIKENGDHYRAIGTCKIVNPDDLFSACVLPEETFIIQ